MSFGDKISRKGYARLGYARLSHTLRENAMEERPLAEALLIRPPPSGLNHHRISILRA